MDLKPGYKQTDMGPVPDDWDVVTVGHIAELNRQSMVPASQPDRPFMHFSLPAFDADKSAQAELGATIRSAKLRVPPGAVLVSKLNPRIPRTWAPELVPKDACASTEWLVLTPRDGTERGFLSVACSSPRFWRQMERATTGTTGSHQRVSPTAAMAIAVAVPGDREEQRAIATVLGDAEALLGALDRLIAKKCDLKLAAMQQLLTGRIRLPGFCHEWRSKRVSELLRYERPDTCLVKSADYEEDGHTPVLTANKSFILGYTNEDSGIFESLPVIIFDDFTTDSKYVDFPFKVKSSAIKILKSRSPDVDLRFVAQRMRLVMFPVGEHKRYYISEYQHVELPTPGPDEQRAIAAVLCDLDAELAALEARRDKTRDLKQAMMQELLTGKTRLVRTGGANA